MVSSERADGGGKFIVRRFQPKDAPQVHALLVEGLVYGRESKCNFLSLFTLHLISFDTSRLAP
jgi:hypothetical protein